MDASIDQVIVDCISKVCRTQYSPDVLGLMLFKSRPAYIALPSDLVDTKITTSRLHEPLKKEEIPINKDAESTAIAHIYQRFTDAFQGELDNNIVVIADVSIGRHHCKKEVADFLATTNLPVYGTPLGKTVVDETSPRYGGVSCSYFKRRH